jgi:hypothetical protein
MGEDAEQAPRRGGSVHHDDPRPAG